MPIVHDWPVQEVFGMLDCASSYTCNTHTHQHWRIFMFTCFTKTRISEY